MSRGSSRLYGDGEGDGDWEEEETESWRFIPLFLIEDVVVFELKVEVAGLFGELITSLRRG